MTALLFIIGCLACYRLTVLFARDTGPFDIFKRLRARWRLFECPRCTSVWAGMIIELFIFGFTTELNCIAVSVCTALAFSAVAIILDRCFTFDA